MLRTTPLFGAAIALSLVLSGGVSAGTKTFLDARSMAMGGTGVAAAHKLNSPFHNPALLAFNRGWKPDDVVATASVGLRETYASPIKQDIQKYQESDVYNRLVNQTLVDTGEDSVDVAIEMRNRLEAIDLNSWRTDSYNYASVLIDTKLITMVAFMSYQQREMIAIRNNDGLLLDTFIGGETSLSPQNLEDALASSVDTTFMEFNQLGLTVSTTEFVGPNMPISMGFTPKIIQMRASHRVAPIQTYDINNETSPFFDRVKLEWNVDVGAAILLTDEFLKDVLGFGPTLRNGEWVAAASIMNLLPTDLSTGSGIRADSTAPRTKISIQPQVQIGVAHYREDYMLTVDLEVTDSEQFTFEGLTRFLSIGGEFFMTNDFHWRGGVRINTSQTSEAAQEKAVLTGGFWYQDRSFRIEAGVMANEVELGGSIEIGVGF